MQKRDKRLWKDNEYVLEGEVRVTCYRLLLPHAFHAPYSNPSINFFCPMHVYGARICLFVCLFGCIKVQLMHVNAVQDQIETCHRDTMPCSYEEWLGIFHMHYYIGTVAI